MTLNLKALDNAKLFGRLSDAQKGAILASNPQLQRDFAVLKLEKTEKEKKEKGKLNDKHARFIAVCI